MAKDTVVFAFVSFLLRFGSMTCLIRLHYVNHTRAFELSLELFIDQQVVDVDQRQYCWWRHWDLGKCRRSGSWPCFFAVVTFRQNATNTPAARYGMGFVFSSATNQLFVFGGHMQDNQGNSGTTCARDFANSAYLQATSMTCRAFRGPQECGCGKAGLTGSTRERATAFST